MISKHSNQILYDRFDKTKRLIHPSGLKNTASSIPKTDQSHSNKKILNKSEKVTGNKILIYLGDYIDRGSNVRETIDTIINFKPRNFQCVFLRGNHDQMLLDFVNNKRNKLGAWLYNDGATTLIRYCGSTSTNKLNNSSSREQLIRETLVKSLPSSHIKFFNELQFSYAWKDYRQNSGVGMVKSLAGGKSFKDSIKSQLKPLGFNLLDDVGTIIGGVKKWRTNKPKGKSVQTVTRKRKAKPIRRNLNNNPTKKRKVKKTPQSGANNIFY